MIKTEAVLIASPNGARIAVIGLGYVGLPLAAEFGKHREVLGFDINPVRIAELKSGHDQTLELTADDLTAAKNLQLSDDVNELADCDVFIITVPTPIDDYKRPDLTPLLAASKMVGRAMRPGAIVVYESTVYPGCTEEDCVPVLEQESNLVFNERFFVGYSPERMNPGDKEHGVTQLVKVTSGSTPEVAQAINELYASIITAGTHLAQSIKVAEAAKVIENIQRDVNIGLVNELAMLFNRMGIDTRSVLEAAATKWNFLPFKPGLVGGHCIGVDPYYLTHKAQSLGFHTDMILAGRRVNDAMGGYIATQVVKTMLQQGIEIKGARILIMGITFKENCPDTRNTRVIDIVRQLQEYNCQVDVYDPWVDAQQVQQQYGLSLIDEPVKGAYDCITLAVGHHQFAEMGEATLREFGKPTHVLYELKYILGDGQPDARL